MDEEKRPRSREKKVVSEGRGVEKRGEGLGTGPVGNAGGYQDRRDQASSAPRGAWQASSSAPLNRPQSARPASSSTPLNRPESARPAPSSTPLNRPQNARPASSTPLNRPQQPQSRPGGDSSASGANPFGSRPASSSPFARPRQSQSGGSSGSGPARSSGPVRGGGGGGKLILIVIALAVLLGGGRLGGLFGGGSDSSDPGALLSGGTGGSSTGSLQSGSGSSQQGTGSLTDLIPGSGSSQQGTGSLTDLIPGSGSSGLTDLFSAFLGSSGSSVYDYSGDPLSLLTGGSGSGGSGSVSSSVPTTILSSSSGGSASAPDTTVAGGAREKFTVLRGKGRDTVTVLVYLCGTDLESQNGMGTSDLKEMAAATLGSKVNLIVYTGGCRRWKNNVVSSSVNQIYRIQDGKLYCLEKDLGAAPMTKPATLTSFIRYGAEHFPADRMCLILWDHGGGSVSGYGYDEKFSSSSSMTLAGINTALKDAGQKFDFIGFDACLMATVENGLMLSQYADYMIASEETEPGVGWYYTNWLTKLGSNTSMPTVEIGKQIADDFVLVCDRQCRGQGTTLSVVDLAELQATVPSALSDFGRGTNELIQNQEYKTVSSARSKTREFAQSTRIDQVDLVHFAKNLGTKEGRALAAAIQGAVKYNRTGGSINNAYGLSIYFPYKRAGKLRQVVSTYQAIGMDEEYTRCIQEFASLELSGQAAAGTSMTNYGGQSVGMSSLLGSLMGSDSYGYSGGIPSSSSGMTDLLGGLFGGSSLGSSDDLFSIFSGRSMTAERAADYLSAHHLDVSLLVWDGDRITLSSAQWGEVESVCRNVFVDDGTGYIDLGLDSEFTLEGGALIDDFDGTWLSIGGQPVAYYYLGTEDDGENYAITGYVPAILNGTTRVNLMLLFDNEHPYGFIDGAEPVYVNGETEACAKTLIRIGEGDSLQFLCDYYDYEGNYRDSYLLGTPVVLGPETEIANTPIGNSPVRVTYCFTDYYQQRYWTPART